MTERKTSSMLQRVPVILAVTAASYGLQVPPAFARPAAGNATAHQAPSPALPAQALPRS